MEKARARILAFLLLPTSSKREKGISILPMSFLLPCQPSGMPTTQTLLILDLIYTGSTVPDGIAGSSIDQSNTPHPSREEQAVSVAQSAAQASIIKMPQKRLFSPLRIKNYYGGKSDNWQYFSEPHVAAKFMYFILTQMGDFYILEVQKLNVWRNKMKVKPLADRVMVKLEKSETKSTGGIIIPDTAQEKTQQGLVVEVGDDKEVIKVKPGQKVMYDKYAGTQIKIDGEEHLILKMSDIIAVVV